MRIPFLLSFTLLLAACGRHTEAQPEPLVARVGEAAISASAFERTYINALLTTGGNDTRKARYRHLDNLVDAYLLADEARRRRLDADSAFRAFETRERRKAAGARFFETAFLDTLPPLSDAQIRTAFARTTQQVVVRHLFYRREADAQAAYERLQAGRSFLDEAQDCYGLVTYDSTAGFLGPIRYFQVDDAFAEAAFALDVGAYSPPVRSRFGYHIIRVEDKVVNPIITESDYQTSKEGIASQVRLRKRRLEGDQFVRDFMGGLDVQVNPEGIRALALAVEDLENSVVPEPVQVAPSLEAVPMDPRVLRASLTPETPLAVYQWRGEPRTFTAGDYYFWLEELPFDEARHRTAASVGRALRNEVFAQEGFARGFEEAPEVSREVAYQSRLRLATVLRSRLRAEAHPPPDDAMLREHFERQGLGQPRWHADFWLVPFATRAEAERAKSTLETHPERAETYPGFTRYTDQALQTIPEWRPYAARAPLNQTVLVGTGAGSWGLLHVTHREAAPVASFEEQKAALAASLTPFMGEYRLLQSLRAETSVSVDTLRFEGLMVLDEGSE